MYSAGLKFTQFVTISFVRNILPRFKGVNRKHFWICPHMSLIWFLMKLKVSPCCIEPCLFFAKHFWIQFELLILFDVFLHLAVTHSC